MLTGNAACLAEQERRRKEALPSPKHSPTPPVFPLLRERVIGVLGEVHDDDDDDGDDDDDDDNDQWCSPTPSVFPLLRELLNLIGDRGIDDVCVGDIDDNGIPVSKKMTTIITQ